MNISLSRKMFLYALLIILSNQLIAQSPEKDYTQYVNPKIGTKGIFRFGRTTPSVTPPFGMTQWVACNFNSHVCWPTYNYLVRQIVGFRGSHKPAMCMGDYGYVTIMPVAGSHAKHRTKHSAWFTHKREVSKPYYYSVRLNHVPRKKIFVEITSSTRCGLFRISFPKKPERNLFIEASREPNGWIKIDTTKNEITGYNTAIQSQPISPKLYNFKGYFVVQFNASITDYGTWTGDTIKDKGTTTTGTRCGARVSFSAQNVMVKIATSFISLDQARENMTKEIPDWNFEKVEEDSKQAWNKYLSRMDIEPADKNQRPIFYTAMYHALLFPRQFSEYGHYYSAFDDKVHSGVSFNDYSLWDTYRAEHPLLLFVTPELVPGMIQSLLQMYKEGGWMPKWPNPTYTSIMIGTHADAVVADAIVKGVKGFDLQLAYEACRKDAMTPPDGDSIKWWHDRDPWTSYEARAGLSWYKKLGYVPADRTAESVSNTLEGAYDDFCVAQVAKAVGKMDDYNELMKRSEYYKNVYNPKTGFMAPKDADGTWHEDAGAGFTEGKPFTYLFSAAQN
ncbi:MAG: glycosyl hydrolase family 92, partial [Bacteroidota bacterium]|nr:glycosyl hydrolase family 92 [Bacteroidota bacterium]